MILRICDFFSGMHSWTKPLQYNLVSRQTFSIDNNPEYAEHTTVIGDFLKLTAEDVINYFGGNKPHVILASPPCTTFSVASCYVHWHPPTKDGVRKPKGKRSLLGYALLEHLVKLCQELDCLFFFENPRGLMRKMPILDGITRHTVWYCQYGDTRAKPTDIWTNSTTWVPRPQCHNKRKDENGILVNHCHHATTPRGSKTGTQGLKNNAERSLIPFELCEEIMYSYLGELNV